MNITQPLKRYGVRKVTRRLSKSLPWVGVIFAVAAVGGAIRRKGFLGGIVHSALDAVPFVGTAKNIVEIGRGRDFIRDRSSATGVRYR